MSFPHVYLAAFLLLSVALPLGADDGGPARQVADLEPTMQAARAFPQPVLRADDAIYFVAGTELSGRELFRTDGTPQGTGLYADFCHGRCSSKPFGTQGPYVELDGALYTAACDGLAAAACDNGYFRQLWRLEEGEAVVIYSGEATSTDSDHGVSDFIAWNGALYFGTFGGVVRRTDGTGPGTVLARMDVELARRIEGFFAIPAVLFFFAQGFDQTDPPGYGPAELWRTDGTVAGTFMLHSFSDVDYSQALLGGEMVFPAHGAAELYKSDGHRVAPLLEDPPFAGGLLLHVIDEVLYLADFRSASEYRLWRTDGTPQGTRFVDLVPTPGRRLLSVSFGGELFFAGAGHDVLLRVPSGSSDAVEVHTFDEPIRELAAAGDRWVMVIATGASVTPRTLWRAEGPPEALTLSRVFSLEEGYFGDVVPLQDGFVLRRGVANDSWLARADEDGDVVALTDTEEGRSSDPHRLAAHHGQLLFLTHVPEAHSPRRAWRSDGTEAGTWQVGETRFPARFVELGEAALLFEENGLVTFAEDGSVAESLGVPGKVIQPAIVRLGEQLLFPVQPQNAVSPPRSVDLWRTDGTVAGTVRLREDIGPSAPYSLDHFADAAAGSDGALILLVDSVWWSDGSAAGTRRVLDRFEQCSHPLGNPVRVGEGFFFTCGQGLWRTDGTPQGTVMVREIDAGEGGAHTTFGELAAVGGRLYFAAVHPEAGEELWTSDGTPEGTRLVRDVRPGPAPSRPRSLTDLGGRLLFTADDGSAGREIWTSDGTPEGTFLLHDLRPGLSPSAPRGLQVIDGRLVFAADDGVSGIELWVSDPSGEHVHLVQDLHPGAPSSDPGELTVVGDRVFFNAGRQATGFELWVLPRTALAERPCAECRAVLDGLEKPRKP